jgi:hypothetical protein
VRVASIFVFVLLAAAGALLWTRTRSLATAMVAAGFAIALIDRLLALVQYLELSALMHAHAGDTLYIVRHYAFLQYAGVAGLGLAAVGLVWHSRHIPRRWHH